MMASAKAATAMGAAVISHSYFLSSLVSPISTRRKSSYKIMGQLRDRVPTLHYTTPSHDKKGDDEDHRDDGGKDWFCIIKKRERGIGPSLPSLV